MLKEKNYALVDAQIMADAVSKESTLYASAFKSYDG